MIQTKEMALLLLFAVGAVGAVATHVMGHVPIDREFDVDVEFARISQDGGTYIFAGGEITNTGDLTISDIEIVWSAANPVTDDGSYDDARNLQNMGPSEVRAIVLEYVGVSDVQSIDFFAQYDDGSQSVQSVEIPP